MDLKFKLGSLVERTKPHISNKMFIGDRDTITKIFYRGNIVSSIQLSNHGTYSFTADCFKLITPEIKTHEIWI
jgi:hypothetical protein